MSEFSKKTPEELLQDLRNLTGDECEKYADNEDDAYYAMYDIFKALDQALSAGQPLPESWNRPPTELRYRK